MSDWYDQARAYDIVYDVDTQREADFLQRVRERYGRTKGRRVLEPACGSGRLLRAFARRGYQVAGFDQNKAMLQYTRRRLRGMEPAPRLERADLANFDLGRRYDLAFCLLSTFQYLPDEEQARGHLRAVARALRPGGIYVMGLHLADYDDEGIHFERWKARRGATEVVCVLRSWPTDRKRRMQSTRSRLMVTNGSRMQRFESSWEFRTYDARQIRYTLKAVPELEHVATYDYDYEIDHPRRLDDERLDTVLVLRKIG